MKAIFVRNLILFLLSGYLTGCGFEHQPQVSTVDINVRLGSTIVYTGRDFFIGTVPSGGTKDFVFTVENIGYRGDLSLTGAPAVAVTGTGFSVTNQPALVTLPIGTGTTFTVRFGPPTIDVFTAIVSIPNNDTGETDFWFSIRGIGS